MATDPTIFYAVDHHFADALPFVAPFLAEAERAGFWVLRASRVPMLRGPNGRRLVIAYDASTGEQIVTFRRWGVPSESLAVVNLTQLRAALRACPAGHYDSVHAVIVSTVNRLARAFAREAA